jgi:hypothetical protein
MQATAVSLLVVAINVTGSPIVDSTLEVGLDGQVSCQINGVPARLQFRGDGISYPVLNPDATSKFKLKANVFADIAGIEAVVGPSKIAGHTRKAEFAFGNDSSSLRTLWFDRPVAPGFDGGLGPAAVPQTRVVLNIGQPVQHALTSFPLQLDGNRVGTTLKVGEADIFIMFNPLAQRTMASAGAGQEIARINGGAWSGEQEQADIYFGVQRPVRELTLATPLKIATLDISKLLVRDNTRVTDVAELKDQANDANEITLPAVTVNAPPKTKPVYRLTLGRDVLDRCASVTFDKAIKQIVLRCGG